MSIAYILAHNRRGLVRLANCLDALKTALTSQAQTQQIDPGR